MFKLLKLELRNANEISPIFSKMKLKLAKPACKIKKKLFSFPFHAKWKDNKINLSNVDRLYKKEKIVMQFSSSFKNTDAF